MSSASSTGKCACVFPRFGFRDCFVELELTKKEEICAHGCAGSTVRFQCFQQEGSHMSSQAWGQVPVDNVYQGSSPS